VGVHQRAAGHRSRHIHGTESAGVDLDSSAAMLGIERGTIYPLALFFAERHTSASTFAIDTTIAEFRVCPDGE